MTLDPVKAVQARIEIASVKKQNGKVDEIVRNAPSMKAETFDMHLMLAGYLASQKEPRYDEAIQHAREAMRTHPDRVGTHALIAAIFAWQQKSSELDATLIAQAEKEYLTIYFPYFHAGSALLNTKTDLPRGERCFRRYLTQEPELNFPSTAAAHGRLGLVLEQEGHKPEAVTEWQTAVKLDPNSPAKHELKKQ
jgi:tetratricopeptide (TPR) repeat protein